MSRGSGSLEGAVARFWLAGRTGISRGLFLGDVPVLDLLEMSLKLTV